ncbi:MAG: glycoside hydrolase family 88 protein, partial [Bacteroidales bacterium]
LENEGGIPKNIKQGETRWNLSRITQWTSGFWPGILWYIYDFTEDEKWLDAARKSTALLESNRKLPYKTHDLSFMMYNSYGHGYKLTNDPKYREILLETVDSLVTLYDPKSGTMLSWPWMVEKKGWLHNTIIDNMMNLELLFWASKNGRPEYYQIAVDHAMNTTKHFIRDNHSTWQVVVFDTVYGKPVQKLTFQGLSDNSTWARGQSWAIYGYVMTYKETQEKQFLETASKLADYYLENLPADLIPYWDFDVTEENQKIKDTSAAAIAAAALMDLCVLVDNPELKKHYFKVAKKMLKTLSSSEYKSLDKNDAFLLHSVGSKPTNGEVNVSLIYTDYYYLEALIRYHKLISNDIF